MKLKISAVAAGAALVAFGASPAYAVDINAGGTNLSIYGVMDGSVYNYTGGAGNTSGYASNNGNTSRLGFAPSRDLGNGRMVGGQFEMEVLFATGGAGDGASGNNQNANPNSAYGNGFSPSVFNRAANVYYRDAAWGEVKLGRQISPALLQAATFDAFGLNSGGYLNHFIYATLVNGQLITGKGGQASINNNGSLYAVDLYNSGIQYTTPTFSGFTFKVFTTVGSNYEPTTYGGGSTATTGALNYSGITDLNLSYMNGNLSLAIDSLSASNNPSTGISTGNYSGNAVVINQYSGSYKFNNLQDKISISYASQTFDSGYAALSGGLDNTTTTSVGWAHNLNPKTRVGLTYTQTADTTASINAAGTTALQMDHMLDTATTLYGQVSSTYNSAASQLAGVYGAQIPGTGSRINAAMVGLRFKF